MHAPPKFGLHRLQLCTQPLGFRVALQQKPSRPGPRADVSQAEERESRRPTEAPLCPLFGGEPAELKESRLLGVQFQRELAESLREFLLETPRITHILETHHKVVSVTHDDNVTARVPPSPLVSPQVEGVVKIDVRKERRNRRSLRRAHLALYLRPVLHHSRAKPFLDQTQDPPIPDSVLQELQHPPMVDGVEEPADVRIEHPVHFLPQDARRQCVESLMLTPPGTKSVGKPDEVDLVNGVHHVDHRGLDDLVFQRCDPERPKPPISLRNEHPARRFRSERSSMNSCMEISEVALQVPAVVFPRHAIYSGCRLWIAPLVAGPEALDRHVVKESSELRRPVRNSDTTYPLQRTERTSPALSPACVLLVRVSSTLR